MRHMSLDINSSSHIIKEFNNDPANKTQQIKRASMPNVSALDQPPQVQIMNKTIKSSLQANPLIQKPSVSSHPSFHKSHSQVSLTFGGMSSTQRRMIEKSELRQEMISKAQAELALQERSYKHLKSALFDFKDTSVSTLGKIGYATSSISQQRMTLKKGLIDTMKEHQRTVAVEQMNIIHIDDWSDHMRSQMGSLSKVTKDIMQRKGYDQKLQMGRLGSSSSNSRSPGKESKPRWIESGQETIAI